MLHSFGDMQRRLPHLRDGDPSIQPDLPLTLPPERPIYGRGDRPSQTAYQPLSRHRMTVRG
jgi:hypothetical protein